MTYDKDPGFSPDVTCNAYTALADGKDRCEACTVMWCRQQRECKFYAPLFEGELVSPCFPCKEYKPGCSFSCPKLAAFDATVKRCEAAGLSPVLDRKTAKRLHKQR